MKSDSALDENIQFRYLKIMPNNNAIVNVFHVCSLVLSVQEKSDVVSVACVGFTVHILCMYFLVKYPSLASKQENAGVSIVSCQMSDSLFLMGRQMDLSSNGAI